MENAGPNLEVLAFQHPVRGPIVLLPCMYGTKNDLMIIILWDRALDKLLVVSAQSFWTFVFNKLSKTQTVFVLSNEMFLPQMKLFMVTIKAPKESFSLFQS